MVPALGADTQVTDFDKGFTTGIVTKLLRRRNWGGQGGPDPLMLYLLDMFRDLLTTIEGTLGTPSQT